MRAVEENTPSGFGFGEAWGNIPTYKKYIPTHLHDFVMTGWKGGPSQATMLDDLAYGYGRFVQGMLHPTLPVLNHHDAMLSSLMHPRLLRMLWNNFRSTETNRINHVVNLFHRELIKMDDVALIRQYIPMSCVCSMGMLCYYDLILVNMGPAVYRVIKPYLMDDKYVGHKMGINDINMLVLNDRCDVFHDVFTRILKEHPLHSITLHDLLSQAVQVSNIVAVRCILNSGLATSIPTYVGPWELCHTYNMHTLEIGKLLVERGYNRPIDEEIIRKMVRVSDDFALIDWMINLAVVRGTCIDLCGIGCSAVACNRKRVWSGLVSRGLVYTTSLANMAAIHGRMCMLEEMHKAGVDCQITIMGEIQPPIPRALETWILRYGV